MTLEELRAEAQQIAILDESIRKQVEAWKLEVEGNKNFLVGMMLSEAHPKIVTYTLTKADQFGPRPMGVKFQWNEPKKASDPQVSQEMLKQAIMAMMDEKQIESEPGELGPESLKLFQKILEMQARGGKLEAEQELEELKQKIKKKMLGDQIDGLKGGLSPDEREQTRLKAQALEAQKAQWERQEREIAEAFGGLRGAGGLYPKKPIGPVAMKVLYPKGTQVYMQFRGFSALGPFALDFSGITKSDGAPEDMGIPINELLNASVRTGDIHPGEFDESGNGFEAFTPSKSEGLMQKLFERFDGQTMKPQAVRNLPNGALLVTMTN